MLSVALFLTILFVLNMTAQGAYYLPGVVPRSYEKDESVIFIPSCFIAPIS
jgi:hypothetical protein